MPELSLDLVVLALLAVAVLRGLLLGLVRESFSLAALAAAVLAVRTFTEPAAASLVPFAGARLSPLALKVLAAAGVGGLALALVAIAGRVARRGVHAAGLGLADRIGGAGLGLAEGLLVAALILTGLAAVLGRDHPALTRSRSFGELVRVERAVGTPEETRRDVAAPPRR